MYELSNSEFRVYKLIFLPHHLTQVLMFPILLDYQPLFTEFELFVEAIDCKHELALSGHQQFPVFYVYLLCTVFLLADSAF